MITVTPEWLKKIDTLASVPDNQLQWFIDKSSQFEIKEGVKLFDEDDLIKGTYILISGRFKVYYMQNGQQKVINDIQLGTITGHLPFSRGTIVGVSAMTTEDAQVMLFPIECMNDLIHTHFELTQALVHRMMDRVREGIVNMQQYEKMMALGKLSAGLAHELNNPAAAIVRSSILLKDHLYLQPDTFKKVINIRTKSENVDAIGDKMFEVKLREQSRTLTLMERSNLEDDLVDWLDDHEVENANEVAEYLVLFGFSIDDLEYFKSLLEPKDLSPVINWINNNLITENMVSEIQEASQRISDLVGSVKNFTHMDRATDMQFSDIRNGIRNTLTMLNHKIKIGNVEIIENFDESLPEVKAFIGELNQVWTNLIDNALDAMEETEHSQLEIKTERDKEFVKVSIIDNGPGIPADVKNNIFDPFFSTKEIGKGTGLGLDVVARIVKQHRGSIKVNSVPGRTEFVVCFLINGE